MWPGGGTLWGEDELEVVAWFHVVVEVDEGAAQGEVALGWVVNQVEDVFAPEDITLLSMLAILSLVGCLQLGEEVVESEGGGEGWVCLLDSDFIAGTIHVLWNL